MLFRSVVVGVVVVVVVVFVVVVVVVGFLLFVSVGGVFSQTGHGDFRLVLLKDPFTRFP